MECFLMQYNNGTRYYNYTSIESVANHFLLYSDCVNCKVLTAPPSLFPQVMDIAKLMKAYISMIVKKRYSNSASISSYGSQCSTW